MKARRRKPQVRQLSFLEQRLTPRLVEILELACRGYSQKEISASLRISLRTLEAHLRLLRARLGARTTSQAIAIFSAEKALGIAGNPYVISSLADRHRSVEPTS